MEGSVNKYSFIVEANIFTYFCSKFGGIEYLTEFLYMSFDHKRLFEKIYTLDDRDTVIVNEFVENLQNLKNKKISNCEEIEMNNYFSNDCFKIIKADDLSCFS